MSLISYIHGREILDSRGVPALEVELTLDNQVSVRVAVPSGASTGSYEALELRDKDSNRFHGKGLLKAISHIENLSHQLRDHSIGHQSELDSFLKSVDGTHNKSLLGANTIMAISLAYAKAVSLSQKKELFEYYNGAYSGRGKEKLGYVLPVPLINILNGGAHANNNLDVQEFMIVPFEFDSFKEALRASSEVFYCLRQLLKKRNFNIAVGDEGGFAPSLSSNEEALKLLLQSIKEAGYRDRIMLALDVAASEFYQNDKYIWEGRSIVADDLINIYKSWRGDYPILSIEDGLAEEDWEAWVSLTRVLGKDTQLVGDDLFVTQIDRLKKGIDRGAANCLLTKINQVGTLTDSYLAVQMAKEAGYACCISHRSGETEDTSIADLAVAWEVKQIKTGSVCRGERVAKYNRLLRIEEKLKNKSLYGGYAGSKAFPLI